MYWAIFYLFANYSSVAKVVPVSVFRFFTISIISILFLHIKIANDLEGNISVDPEVIEVPFKTYFRVLSYFLFYQKIIESIIQISSFQHLANKYYSFH